MKKLKSLIMLMVMISIISCQQKKSDTTELKARVIEKEIKTEPNKVVFDNLDLILSPFEDMTEFALEKNEIQIQKSMAKIYRINAEGVFEKNIASQSVLLLKTKIERLKELINHNNYNEIAMLSTEIFEFNISNFKDGFKIDNQIQIEHLDYMGFKNLALLNQNNVDWEKLKQTTEKSQKIWVSLSSKVADKNLKDTFDLLFEGLSIGIKNKDIKVCKVFSNMDLTLVDVLEKSI